MNYVKSFSAKVALLSVFCSVYSGNNNAHINFGAHINYLNSVVKTNYKDDFVGLSLIDAYDYAVSGFAPGVHIGYTFDIKDNYYINAKFAASYANAEQKGSHTNNGDDRESTFKLNHILYPYITVGYQPTPDTKIGISAGYGRENWSTTQTGANIIFITDADYDSNGWLIGGEISTHLMHHFSLSLSGMYSRIDKITTSYSDALRLQTHTLSLEPETTTISVALHYIQSD